MKIGSRLYEVNDWTWRFGRPKARDQKVSDAQQERAQKIVKAAKKRSATRKHNRNVEQRAADFAVRLNFPASSRGTIHIRMAVAES